MALSIEEAWKSGDGSLGRDSSDTYSAIVSGSIETDNADDAATVMRFAAAHFSFVSPLGNILTSLDRERVAPGIWRMTATYRSPSSDRQTNDASFSFSTGGGTQHITQSLQTIGTFAAGFPPNFKGAIGVSDNSIEGVDIHVPTFEFDTSFYLPVPAMSKDYVAQLYALSGKVNSDKVAMNVDGVELTFQPGELLFLGAKGSKRRGFGDWELTLSWSASANLQNLVIGDIEGIAKDGWDYLWVRYKTSVDSTSNAMVQVPLAVYVERVYYRSPLSLLLPKTAFGEGNAQPWLSPPTGTGGLS